MTDGPTDASSGASTGGVTGGRPLTPEQEDQVSRLLAAASGPVDMPPDVAARLDNVLADLQQERAATDVVELRARRRWPRLLLAAAAVVVGGYAVGTVASQGTLSGSDSGDAGAASDSSSPQEDMLLAEEPTELDGGSTSDSDGEGGAESGAESAPGLSSQRSQMRTTVRLRSDRLDAGVLRALRVLDARPVSESTSDSAEDDGCPAPELDEGERSLTVRYDGEPAVLVTGPTRGDTVPATVYSCSGDELDSTLVRR